MKAIKQEHFSGCAISCVAFIIQANYQNTLRYFDKGNENAKFRGFLCSEIVKALGKAGYKFHFKYTGRMKKYNFPNNTIVHIKKSKKYPVGHYLCLTQKGWMDSWINFPRLNARAGFRKRLPGKPIYAIVPIT
ncbi:MAG: hypothetical protein AAB532_00990 [Patescibacteria group bacterium]